MRPTCPHCGVPDRAEIYRAIRDFSKAWDDRPWVADPKDRPAGIFYKQITVKVHPVTGLCQLCHYHLHKAPTWAAAIFQEQTQ